MDNKEKIKKALLDFASTLGTGDQTIREAKKKNIASAFSESDKKAPAKKSSRNKTPTEPHNDQLTSLLSQYTEALGSDNKQHRDDTKKQVMELVNNQIQDVKQEEKKQFKQYIDDIDGMFNPTGGQKAKSKPIISEELQEYIDGKVDEINQRVQQLSTDHAFAVQPTPSTEVGGGTNAKQLAVGGKIDGNIRVTGSTKPPTEDDNPEFWELSGAPAFSVAQPVSGIKLASFYKLDEHGNVMNAGLEIDEHGDVVIPGRLTVGQGITMEDVTIERSNIADEDLVPRQTDTFTLGTISNQYNKLYVRDISATGLADINNITTNSLTASNIDLENVDTNTLQVHETVDSNLIPGGNDITIGSLNKPWGAIYTTDLSASQDLYVGRNIVVDQDTKIQGNLQVDGTIVGATTTKTDTVSADNLHITTSTGLSGDMTIGVLGRPPSAADRLAINSQLSTSLIPVTSSNLNLGASGDYGWHQVYAGYMDLTNDLSVGGSATIGTVNTDQVYLRSEVASNIVPSTSGTTTQQKLDGETNHNLGTPEKRWNEIHVVTVTAHGDVMTDKDVIVNRNLSVSGTSTLSGDVHIHGDLTVDGTTYLSAGENQTIHVGNSADDSVIFNADVRSDIIPDNNTFSLGSTEQEWNNLHVQNVSASQNTVLGSDNTDKLAINADITTNIEPDTNILTIGNILQPWHTLYVRDISAAGDVTFGDSTDDRVSINGEIDTHVVPVTGSDKNLGSDNNKWGTLFTTYISAASSANIGTDLTVERDTTIERNLAVSGTSTLSGDVHIHGDLRVDGNAYLSAGDDGNIYVGDADTDNVVFRADVDSSIEPDKNATYNLGSVAQQWKTLYTQDISASNDVTIHGDTTIGNSSDDRLYINSEIDTDLVPVSGTTHDLGHGDQPWRTLQTQDVSANRNITADNNLAVSGTSTLHDDVTIHNDLIVNTDTFLEGHTHVGTDWADRVSVNAMVNTNVVPVYKNQAYTSFVTPFTGVETGSPDNLFITNTPGWSVSGTNIDNATLQIDLLDETIVGFDKMTWQFRDNVTGTDVRRSLEIYIPSRGTWEPIFEETADTSGVQTKEIVLADGHEFKTLEFTKIRFTIQCDNTRDNINFETWSWRAMREVTPGTMQVAATHETIDWRYTQKTFDLGTPDKLWYNIYSYNNYLTGVLQVSGNTTLGNSATDTVTFDSRIDSDMSPVTGTFHDLGHVDNKWNQLHVRDISAYSNLDVYGDTVLGTDNNNNVTFNSDIDSNMIPNVADTYDVGSVTQPWLTLYSNNLSASDDAHVGDNLNVGGDGTVQGNMYIKGDLHVDGNAYLSAGPGGYINVGDTDVDNVVFKAEIASNVSPTDDAQYDFGMQNKKWRVIHTQDLSASNNIHAANNLLVSGDTQLSGNVVLGTDDTDNVTFKSEVDSDVVPNTSQTHDLGSIDKPWATLNTQDVSATRDITVGQDAQINRNATIDNDLTVLNDATVQADLHVQQSAKIDGNTVLGTSDLNNVTFNADVNSSIEPDQTKQYNLGSDPQQWSTVFTQDVSASRNTNIGQDLTVDRDTTVKRDLSVLSNVNVSNDTTIDGDTTIGADDSSTVSINADVTSDIIPDRDEFRNLGNNTDKWNTLYVHNVSAADRVDIQQDLQVGRDASIGNDINVNRDLIVDRESRLNGDTYIGDSAEDDLIITAKIKSDVLPDVNNLYSLGNVEDNWKTLYVQTVETSDTVNIGNDLNVSDDADVGGYLTVSGVGEIVGDFTIGGDLRVAGSTYLAASQDGTIQLGTDDGDDVVFNAEIASAMSPDIHQAYDLGATSKSWRDMYLRSIIASYNADIGNSATVGNNLTVGNELQVRNIATFDDNVHIKGDLRVDGNTYLSGGEGGTINVGDSTIDRVVFVADVHSDILPNQSDLYDLGKQDQRWKSINTQSVYATQDGQFQRDVTVQRDLTVNNDVEIKGNAHVTGNLRVDGNAYLSAGFGGYINVGDSSQDNVVFNADVVSNILPGDTESYDLGSGPKQWRDLHVQDANVYRDTTIGNDLQVNRDTTIDRNLEVANNALIQEDLTVANTLAVSSDITTDGDLHVRGDVYLSGGKYGKVFVGNTDDDDVIFNSQVASDFIPDTDQTFDLGSLEKQWKTIHTQDLSASRNLLVQGDTVLGTTDDETVTFRADISSNILPASSQLYTLGNPLSEWLTLYTKDAVVSNNLQVANDVEIGNTLDVTNTITASGDIHAKQSVTVDQHTQLNTLTASGDIHAKQSVTVDQHTQLNTLTATGNTQLDTLTVQDEANLLDKLYVSDDVHAQSSLNVALSSNLNDLIVSGDTNIQSLTGEDANLQHVYTNILDVVDDTVVNQLTATGNTQLNTMSATGHVDLQTLTTHQQATLSALLAGPTTIDQTLDVVGPTTMSGLTTNQLIVQDHSIQDTLEVGVTQMKSTLDVAGKTTLSGDTDIKSDLRVEQQLAVTNDATFDSDVHIKGDLRVDGNAYLSAGAQGTINVGDSSQDSVIFNADVSSDIIPDTDGAHDLGSNLYRWNNVYTKTADIDTALNVTGGTTTSSLTSTDILVTNNMSVSGDTVLDDLTVNNHVDLSSVSAEQIVVESLTAQQTTTDQLSVLNFEATHVTDHLTPIDQTITLGTTDTPWVSSFAHTISATDIITDGIQIKGVLDIDSLQGVDLGDEANPWDNLYSNHVHVLSTLGVSGNATLGDSLEDELAVGASVVTDVVPEYNRDPQTYTPSVTASAGTAAALAGSVDALFDEAVDSKWSANLTSITSPFTVSKIIEMHVPIPVFDEYEWHHTVGVGGGTRSIEVRDSETGQWHLLNTDSFTSNTGTALQTHSGQIAPESEFATMRVNGLRLSYNNTKTSPHLFDTSYFVFKLNGEVIDWRTIINDVMHDLGLQTNPWNNVHALNGHIQEDLDVKGSTTLGTNNFDTVIFNADVLSDIDPDSTDTHSLGNPLQQWKNTYTTGLSTVNLSAGGLVYPTTDGQSRDVLMTDGAGQLSWGSPQRVVMDIRNDDDVELAPGDPVYAVGEVGNSGVVRVKKAHADDPATMPAIGLIRDTVSTNDNGEIIISGVYNTNLTGFSDVSAGDTLYVGTDGLTTIKPAGAQQIQNIGQVLRTNGSIVQGVKVSSIDRTNDVPNLSADHIFYGENGYSEQKTLTGAIAQQSVITTQTLDATRILSGGTDLSIDLQTKAEQIESLYNYLISDYTNSIDVAASTMSEYMATIYPTASAGLEIGDVITLKNSSDQYILTNKTGDPADDWKFVTLRPDTVIVDNDLTNDKAFDSFLLTQFKSAKYVIQVEHTSSGEVLFTELSIVSNGLEYSITEYGLNYTSTQPFVEFDAEITTGTLSLKISNANGFTNINNCVLNAKRTNLR